MNTPPQKSFGGTMSLHSHSVECDNSFCLTKFCPPKGCGYNAGWYGGCGLLWGFRINPFEEFHTAEANEAGSPTYYGAKRHYIASYPAFTGGGKNAWFQPFVHA